MEEGDIRRLEILQLDDAEDDTCMTFVLKNEDHTLGNALRYMIMKNPEVTFCGYSVPHPSERKINIRIQTSVDALRRGLEDLQELCSHVLLTFQEATSSYSEPM